MLEFIQKAFSTGLTILSSVNPLNATELNATPLKCISMNNQECKVKPDIFHVKSDELILYRFSVKTSKCSDSCSNIKN